MSSESTFAKTFRQYPFVINEGTKRLEDVPTQIRGYLQQHGGVEIYDAAKAVYARSLGSSPLPEQNLENLIRNERRDTSEVISNYADYLESISPLDSTLRDMSEQAGIPQECWSNIGSEKLRLMVDQIWDGNALWKWILKCLQKRKRPI